MEVKKFRKWLKRHNKEALTGLVAALTTAVLLLTHLGNLVSGISNREWAVRQVSLSLQAIAHQPQNWPLTLVQWLTGWLPGYPVWWLRVPSVLFAALTLAAVTYILRRWYGPRTAFFGFVIFATSAWFLHIGRLAGFDIMYLWALPALLSSHLLLYDHVETKKVLFLWLVIQLMLLSVPGMVWFVLLNAILQRQDIKESLALFKSWLWRLGLAVVCVVLLAPLVVGLVVGDTSRLAINLLGLPSAVPTIGGVLSRAGHGLLFVAVRGSASNDLWLNHLPILDAFMTCALLVGAYFYSRHVKAARTQLIAGYLLLGFVLYDLGGPVTLSIIVPLLYLVAAAGIAYLLHIWLTVFPRNPLARGLGIGVLAIAISVSSIYSLRQYFLAWPHHPGTQSAFTERTRPRSHL